MEQHILFLIFQQNITDKRLPVKQERQRLEQMELLMHGLLFFTPVENPQIVATILVEKGGQGSQVAGPIARKIADFYFQVVSVY